MRYVAALDYNNLDNGVFLTTLARSLSQLQDKKEIRSIIIHSDSAYTERIMQTGVMRDEATLRSIKDLNNRLIALFADQGVSAIGINPYQRELISATEDQLHINRSFFENLPEQSTLIISSAVFDTTEKKPSILPLPRLARFLANELQADELFIFSQSEKAEIFTSSQNAGRKRWDLLEDDFQQQNIPEEFRDFQQPVRLSSARDLNRLPELEHTLLIE